VYVAVAEKDQSGNDWLLLTAGAPNQQGLTFPGEELVGSLVVEHPPPMLAEAPRVKRPGFHRGSLIWVPASSVGLD
jgi:hypothetical protein